MFQESAYVFFMDIEPSYEDMSVGLVTRKSETRTIEVLVVLALVVLTDTWLPTHCYTKLKLDD